MPVRIEFHHVPHPFQLCVQCNESLGSECITLDPGNPRMKQVYVCKEHFGSTLQDLGDALMRLYEHEEGNGNE